MTPALKKGRLLESSALPTESHSKSFKEIVQATNKTLKESFSSRPERKLSKKSDRIVIEFEKIPAKVTPVK